MKLKIIKIIINKNVFLKPFPISSSSRKIFYIINTRSERKVRVICIVVQKFYIHKFFNKIAMRNEIFDITFDNNVYDNSDNIVIIYVKITRYTDSNLLIKRINAFSNDLP